MPFDRPARSHQRIQAATPLRRHLRDRRPTAARPPTQQKYREIGQVPVTINREIDGFVLNRLQGALIAEAFRLVGEGYISAQDLDRGDPLPQPSHRRVPP